MNQLSSRDLVKNEISKFISNCIFANCAQLESSDGDGVIHTTGKYHFRLLRPCRNISAEIRSQI